jgi:hypothetical protein
LSNTKETKERFGGEPLFLYRFLPFLYRFPFRGKNWSKTDRFWYDFLFFCGQKPVAGVVYMQNFTKTDRFWYDFSICPENRSKTDRKWYEFRILLFQEETETPECFVSSGSRPGLVALTPETRLQQCLGFNTVPRCHLVAWLLVFYSLSRHTDLSKNRRSANIAGSANCHSFTETN